MQLDDLEKSYLWDMLDASNDIKEFVKQVTFEQFENNKLIRFAVERQLLVVGEAARKISETTKTKLSEIPWKPIIGLRNIIAHDYGEILTANIWKVATQNIPDLIKELKKYV